MLAFTTFFIHGTSQYEIPFFLYSLLLTVFLLDREYQIFSAKDILYLRLIFQIDSYPMYDIIYEISEVPLTTMYL